MPAGFFDALRYFLLDNPDAARYFDVRIDVVQPAEPILGVRNT